MKATAENQMHEDAVDYSKIIIKEAMLKHEINTMQSKGAVKEYEKGNAY